MKLIYEDARAHGKDIYTADMYVVTTWKDSVDPLAYFPDDADMKDALVFPLWTKAAGPEHYLLCMPRGEGARRSQAAKQRNVERYTLGSFIDLVDDMPAVQTKDVPLSSGTQSLDTNNSPVCHEAQNCPSHTGFLSSGGCTIWVEQKPSVCSEQYHSSHDECLQKDVLNAVLLHRDELYTSMPFQRKIKDRTGLGHVSVAELPKLCTLHNTTFSIKHGESCCGVIGVDFYDDS
ncbi:uncharacterized protein LOC113074882 [Carassius auratus]|uniref:Uncharacterized protein LOC113074882 n=1 Tax=Carassius auratus TaxID=7957 RepID=A0A6P6N4S3_CARAU|nr:uncharacterized protein LOC113074882 [Carassius auratus]